MSGTSKISNKGGGVILLTGITTAYQSVSTIYANVMYDRMVNGSWMYQGTCYFSASNTSSVDQSESRSVARGYYYRARGCLLYTSFQLRNNVLKVFVRFGQLFHFYPILFIHHSTSMYSVTLAIGNFKQNSVTKFDKISKCRFVKHGRNRIRRKFWPKPEEKYIQSK